MLKLIILKYFILSLFCIINIREKATKETFYIRFHNDTQYEFLKSKIKEFFFYRSHNLV